MPRMTASELRRYEANIDTAIPAIQQISLALQDRVDPVMTPSTALEQESPGLAQEPNAGASPHSPRTAPVPLKMAKPEPSLQDLIGDQQFPRPPTRVRQFTQSQHPARNSSQECLPMNAVRTGHKRRLSSVENNCIITGHSRVLPASAQGGPLRPSMLAEKCVAVDLKTPFSTPEVIDTKDKGHRANKD